jgi:hypothetical protein
MTLLTLPAIISLPVFSWIDQGAALAPTHENVKGSTAGDARDPHRARATNKRREISLHFSPKGCRRKIGAVC